MSCKARDCPHTIMRISTTIGKRLVGIGILLCLTGLGIVAPCVISLAQDGKSILIANTTVPDRPFSMTEIQNIFLGKVTKIEGTKITFVILKAGDVHTDFLAVYLSRTPSQYTQYWKKLVFSGKGKSPKALETEDELIRYLAETPGAIGYIGVAAAETLNNENLRPVTIE